MSLAVRCITCGKVIGRYEDRYEALYNKIEEEKIDTDTAGLLRVKFFNDNKINRICCRRMFMGYVPLQTQLGEIPRVQDIQEQYANMKLTEK